MSVTRNNKRAVAVTSMGGYRNLTTAVSSEVARRFDEACRERGMTKSALLREFIGERVNLEGHE